MNPIIAIIEYGQPMLHCTNIWAIVNIVSYWIPKSTFIGSVSKEYYSIEMVGKADSEKGNWYHYDTVSDIAFIF